MEQKGKRGEARAAEARRGEGKKMRGARRRKRRLRRRGRDCKRTQRERENRDKGGLKKTRKKKVKNKTRTCQEGRKVRSGLKEKGRDRWGKQLTHARAPFIFLKFYMISQLIGYSLPFYCRPSCFAFHPSITHGLASTPNVVFTLNIDRGLKEQGVKHTKRRRDRESARR